MLAGLIYNVEVLWKANVLWNLRSFKFVPLVFCMVYGCLKRKYIYFLIQSYLCFIDPPYISLIIRSSIPLFCVCVCTNFCVILKLPCRFINFFLLVFLMHLLGPCQFCFFYVRDIISFCSLLMLFVCLISF